jgi:hypothetical protein
LSRKSANSAAKGPSMTSDALFSLFRRIRAQADS